MPVSVPAVSGIGGIIVPASPPPEGWFETWYESNAFKYLTTADLWTYPPPSSPRSSITSVLAGYQYTAPSFFGLHVQTSTAISAAVAQVPCAILRSHDSGGGMRWHSVNPSAGVLTWSTSDAWVDSAVNAGKEILYTLGFTPDWAAASTPNTGKYDNGTTARATNQPPANTAHWDAYCSAVATRYLGKVNHFEVWNEVNYASYWSGTAAQLATLLRRASQIIKAINPSAKIIAPIVQEPETGGTGNAYLQSVLDASDGATGTGKDWIDIIGVHLYPPKYNFQVHADQLANIKATLAARSLSALPIWNTETGVLQGTGVSDDVQAKWLGRSLLLQAALGLQRSFWYSFDNDVMYMTDADRAAWNHVRSALISGPMTGCNIAPDGRVACTIAGVNILY